MTSPHSPAIDWSLTPSAQQRRGVPVDEITCVVCGAVWDGTTPYALPACTTCRALAGTVLLAAVDALLAEGVLRDTG